MCGKIFQKKFIFLFERRVLYDVVQKLKRCAKEGQVAFEKSVKTKGLEFTCTRTAEGFSLGDYASWLWQVHSTYRANLDCKRRALMRLEYTSRSVREICCFWEKEPNEEVKGEFRCLF